MVGERDGDVRAHRDDGRLEVVGQPPRELEDRRAAADGDDVAGAHERDRRLGDRPLRVDVVGQALLEARRPRRRRRQRAAVHAAQRPAAASSARSRRTVSSETPSSSLSRAARTLPVCPQAAQDDLAALLAQQLSHDGHTGTIAQKAAEAARPGEQSERSRAGERGVGAITERTGR